MSVVVFIMHLQPVGNQFNSWECIVIVSYIKTTLPTEAVSDVLYEWVKMYDWCIVVNYLMEVAKCCTNWESLTFHMTLQLNWLKSFWDKKEQTFAILTTLSCWPSPGGWLGFWWVCPRLWQSVQTLASHCAPSPSSPTWADVAPQGSPLEQEGGTPHL